MSDEILTDESLSGADDVAAADGKSADSDKDGDGSEAVDGDEYALARINAALGKEFKDLPSALKSLKDTQSYVGKKAVKEEKVVEKVVEKPVDTSKFVTREELENEKFIASKQLSDDMSAILKSIASAQGKSVKEAFDSEVFQNTYKAVTSHDKELRSKSVLETNSRLKVVEDKFAQANEALAKGDYQAASKAAVWSVLDMMKAQAEE